MNDLETVPVAPIITYYLLLLLMVLLVLFSFLHSTCAVFLL